MPDQFVVRQGDTAQTLTSTLTDADDNPVDIAGATVTFTMGPIAGGDAKVNAAAASNDQNGDGSDGSTGNVSYTWAAADTNTAGLYLGAWEVTFAGGAKLSFPNGGYLLIRVTPDLPVAATGYTSVETIKKTRNLSGTTYADDDIQLAILAASQGIDRVCGRTFNLDDEQADPADYTARYYQPASPLLLLIDDLTTFAELATDGGYDGSFADTWTVNTDFVLQPLNAAADGEPYCSIRLSDGDLRSFPPGPRTVRVKGRWGWPTVPDPIRQATGILAAMLLLRNREAPFGVVTSGVEIGAIARIARDDPQVMFLIRPFMRDLTMAAA